MQTITATIEAELAERLDELERRELQLLDVAVGGHLPAEIAAAVELVRAQRVRLLTRAG